MSARENRKGHRKLSLQEAIEIARNGGDITKRIRDLNKISQVLIQGKK